MNNKKKKIIDMITKIILIIIIIILLIRNCELSKQNNIKTPTGNVEIIDINCDSNTYCEIESDINNTNTNERQNNTTNKNSNNTDSNKEQNPNTDTKPEEAEPEQPFEYDDKLTVYDKKITWDGVTEAKIFSNSMYVKEGKIAPESSNTYQFIVRNGTKYNLNYKIKFIETNPYNINMKYKLKKNNEYIISEYVSASELNLSDIILSSAKSDTFYLEWKWISSNNDTEIGESQNVNYGLKIEVEAESIN